MKRSSDPRNGPERRFIYPGEAATPDLRVFPVARRGKIAPWLLSTTLAAIDLAKRFATS